ncbi:ubiquitin-conjugating enzyme E2 E1-like [Haemaphysalis longicornis]
MADYWMDPGSGSSCAAFFCRGGGGGPRLLSVTAKWLQKELVDFMLDPPPNCSAGPKAGNLYEWAASFAGPPGSPYEGGKFLLDFQFGQQYPYKPPRVTFRTRVYHCNVDNRGRISVDILGDKWSPALTVAKVLLSISSLLADCNPWMPVSTAIASQYFNDRKEHDRMARLWTLRYATQQRPRMCCEDGGAQGNRCCCLR